MIDYSYLLGLSKKELIHTPEKITKTLNRFAKEFLTKHKLKKPSTPKYRVSNYDELVETIEIHTPTQSSRLETMAVDDGGMLDVVNALPVLNDIPRNTIQTLFGLDERDVADIEKSKYARMMNVATNPLYLLDLMGSGLLSVSETNHASVFYPEFVDQLKQTILEQVGKLQGNPDAELDWAHNRVLSNLFKVSRFSQTQVEMLQANVTKDEEEKKAKEMNLPDIQTETSKTLHK